VIGFPQNQWSVSTITRNDVVVNALTIDVEDWFHATFLGIPESSWSQCETRVVSSTERLLQILNESGVYATFFVLGWVAERAPALVRMIAEKGHEVASHGTMHRQVFRQTPDEFEADVRKSVDLIRKVIDQPILGYRAPAFSIGVNQLWALEILSDLGFLYDASVFPVRTPVYGIANAPRFVHPICGGRMLEIPPATVKMGPWRLPIAGGVYTRVLPLSFTLWGIRRLNQKEKRPAVMYLHPWELDPKRPPAGKNGLARWSHGLGKSATSDRLRQLLSTFPFAPIREVFSLPYRQDNGGKNDA
jgi:polysaccharide deacetylase family protein (PEP-CTERM system associated)